eukprot:5593592-Prymnesium_polylepis.1
MRHETCDMRHATCDMSMDGCMGAQAPSACARDVCTERARAARRAAAAARAHLRRLVELERVRGELREGEAHGL